MCIRDRSASAAVRAATLARSCRDGGVRSRLGAIPLRDVPCARVREEQFGRCCPIEDAAGPGVDPGGDVVEVPQRELSQVRAFGQVLTQEAVGAVSYTHLRA